MLKTTELATIFG